MHGAFCDVTQSNTIRPHNTILDYGVAWAPVWHKQIIETDRNYSDKQILFWLSGTFRNAKTN